MPRLRLALAQTNPVLGDLVGNARQVLDAARSAAEQGAELLATGEMAITGYPIEDLASRPSFLAASHDAIISLAKSLLDDGLGDLVVVVGHPDGPFEPRQLGASNAPTAIAQNCASVLHHGHVKGTYAKHHLPNYSVFDEYRNFIPGDELLVVRVNHVDVAIIICEDLWRDGGPVDLAVNSEAGVLLVLNASPFEREKSEVRLPLVNRRATESDSIVAYVNIVGGQDDLVFDGDSIVVDGHGKILGRSPQFSEDLLILDVEAETAIDNAPPLGVRRIMLEAGRSAKTDIEMQVSKPAGELEQVWNALVLGLRDYVLKNGFKSVILGLSGGIDSAVCAVLAADAIGPKAVHCVSLPSRYSSEHSRTDADQLAERVGLNFHVQPIAHFVAAFEEQLGLQGLAAENLQARVRAVVLMGLSNTHGHLVLTTGNKSELAVGYTTIYGDSAGGFAPLKDVPKTLVWRLAEWRNSFAADRGEAPPIPENSITKPPSAELRPGQKDEDSLPPYDVLDGILEAYVTRKLGARDVIALGFDADTVEKVTTLVDRAEWKRRQGAVGPKISGMAFGRDRRLPITYRPRSD